METINQSPQATDITSKGKYIASAMIGTKSAQLYLLDDQHFVVWYKREVNFVSVFKVEQVSEETARMLFPI